MHVGPRQKSRDASGPPDFLAINAVLFLGRPSWLTLLNHENVYIVYERADNEVRRLVQPSKNRLITKAIVS